MYTPPPDKVLHFAVGTMAAMLGVIAAWAVDQAGVPTQPLLGGVFACGAASLAREAYNLKQGGVFDWRDVAATLAGAVPVLAVTAVQAIPFG